MTYRMHVLPEKNDDFAAFLKTMIRQFNNEHSPHHAQIRIPGVIKPIQIAVAEEGDFADVGSAESAEVAELAAEVIAESAAQATEAATQTTESAAQTTVEPATKWAGGISADVYWGWVEIHDFWLREECRGQGLGGSLLHQVEDIAKGMGATRALLTTFEFQAKSFYAAHGYYIVGEIKDYPPGSTYYTMVKDLAE